METDQVEQGAALLHESTRVLNKNQGVEETDISTTLKSDNRSPSTMDNRDTQTTIVMNEKKRFESDIDVPLETCEPKVTYGKPIHSSH